MTNFNHIKVLLPAGVIVIKAPTFHKTSKVYNKNNINNSRPYNLCGFIRIGCILFKNVFFLLFFKKQNKNKTILSPPSESG